MGNQNDMALLLAVVDHGSFSAAGRALGQTPSAVGKRVRILEERLGVGLFIRSTRRMTLTQAGRRYSEEAREILARIVALEDNIAESIGHLRGTIRLTSPQAFGQRFVVPAITKFMQIHSDVEIELLMTDKAIDLVGEGFDLAIRTGKHESSSLMGRTIMPYGRTICAAPNYIKDHGRPKAPADLTSHRCLKLPHEKLLTTWEVDDPERKGLRLGRGLVCNSLDALNTACLVGEGIACLPDFLTQENLSLGRLVPMLEESSKPSDAGSVSILRPETAITARRMGIFSDFLYGQIRKEVISKVLSVSPRN